MKNKFKFINGITLISLVITIILLLILAGISLSLLLNSTLFEQAYFAKHKIENAQNEENEILEEYTNLINNFTEKENNSYFLLAELFSFTPNNTSWNVENVKEALDYLYNN